jgi:hypothetical protein
VLVEVIKNTVRVAAKNRIRVMSEPAEVVECSDIGSSELFYISLKTDGLQREKRFPFVGIKR